MTSYYKKMIAGIITYLIKKYQQQESQLQTKPLQEKRSRIRPLSNVSQEKRKQNESQQVIQAEKHDAHIINKCIHSITVVKQDHTIL